MPYNANSRSQQRIRMRLEAAEQGADPDAASGYAVEPPALTSQQAAIVAEAIDNGGNMSQAAEVVTGQTGIAAGVYGHRALKAAAKLKTLRDAVEKRRGLRADALAKKLDKAVQCMDSVDLAERQYGLKSWVVAAKIRGDMATQAAPTPPPPPNLNVLIQVMRELQEPQALVVEALDNADVNGHAPQPMDKVE